MRRLYFIVPLLLWAGAAWGADNWTYFADPSGALTLQVPSAPLVGHDSTTGASGKPLPIATYTIERKQGALLLMITDLSSLADVSETATNGVARMKNASASGFSDAPITVDGHAGHDVHLTNPAGIKIEDRLFVIGKKLYQIMTVLAVDASPDSVAMAQRFAGSIHFLHP